VYGYSPDAALDLSPRDRIELVKRETGVVVDATASYNILLGLGTRNLTLLAQYPAIYDYLLEHYPWKDLVQPMIKSGTLEAIDILLVRGGLAGFEVLREFVKSSNYDPQVLERLHLDISPRLRGVLTSLASEYPIALAELFRLYPDFDPAQLRLPLNVQVLDDLLARGFREIVADWVPSIPAFGKAPVVRWFLRHFPQLRTAENVVKAIDEWNWTFVKLTANSTSIGREAMRQLVATPYDDDRSDLEKHLIALTTCND